MVPPLQDPHHTREAPTAEAVPLHGPRSRELKIMIGTEELSNAGLEIEIECSDHKKSGQCKMYTYLLISARVVTQLTTARPNI